MAYNEKDCCNNSYNSSDFNTSIILTTSYQSNITNISHNDGDNINRCFGKNSYLDYSNNSSVNYNYPSYCYGFTFFIAERQKHYTNLDIEVFKPLANGILSQSNSENFLTALRCDINIPTTSVHYEHATLHMDKDKRGLKEQIKQLTEDAYLHNRKVEELQNKINETIKSSFRISTTLSTGGYYKYNHDMVLILALGIWKSNVREKDDVDIAINRIKISLQDENNHKFELGNSLRLNGNHIGDGNTTELEQMKDRFLKIPVNNVLVNDIISSKKSLKNLYDLIGKISYNAGEISRMIENGSYRQKAKCCPTFIRLIEDYLF